MCAHRPPYELWCSAIQLAQLQAVPEICVPPFSRPPRTASTPEHHKRHTKHEERLIAPRFWTRIVHHDGHDHLQRARAPHGAQNAGLLGLDRHIGVRLSSTLSCGHRACRRCTVPGHPAQA